jgi:stage II sporulation protein P
MLDRGFYEVGFMTRTKDSALNMVRVGKAICEEIEKAGYQVIHDTEIHDLSYNGAYAHSRKKVEEYLKKYPTIEVVLDVLRDAIQQSDGTKIKPTARIQGKKAAQIMIISGCEGDGVNGFPHWEKNVTFALGLQSRAEEMYPELMRPVFFCNRKYNMDVTPCSLLLEFGTDANTLEEAVYSAELIGSAIADMLDKNLN